MGQIASIRRRTNVPNVTDGTYNDDENCEMHCFSSHPGKKQIIRFRMIKFHDLLGGSKCLMQILVIFLQ